MFVAEEPLRSRITTWAGLMLLVAVAVGLFGQGRLLRPGAVVRRGAGRGGDRAGTDRVATDPQ